MDNSHSMAECGHVCNRLGIMVHGQLACLGTMEHLKSKLKFVQILMISM
jgi:ABC-type multidrug transport system ATPase subunit